MALREDNMALLATNVYGKRKPRNVVKVSRDRFALPILPDNGQKVHVNLVNY
jgi:hypothetical protein